MIYFLRFISQFPAKQTGLRAGILIQREIRLLLQKEMQYFLNKIVLQIQWFFRCEDGKYCIFENLVCDGYTQCEDESGKSDIK